MLLAEVTYKRGRLGVKEQLAPLGMLEVKGPVPTPNSDMITLPLMGFEPTTFGTKAQSPNALTHHPIRHRHNYFIFY